MKCQNEVCHNQVSEYRRTRKARFCSTLCRRLNYKTKMGIVGTGLATATTGAIGELVIATDLLRKGYEVFRAMSPSCSCDLAILKNHTLLRIEVRTGYRNAITGLLMENIPKDSSRYDILATVVNTGEIVYRPDLQ